MQTLFIPFEELHTLPIWLESKESFGSDTKHLLEWLYQSGFLVANTGNIFGYINFFTEFLRMILKAHKIIRKLGTRVGK